MMRSIKKLNLTGSTLFVVSLLFAWSGNAQTDLSDKALFYRCYGQLTQQRPEQDDPLMAQVLAGQISPINACMQVLNSADFSDTTGRISDPNDPTAVSVLRTMHNLHSSWFSNKDFPDPETMDWLDASAPGFYFTKAMFDSSMNFSAVVTSNDNLVAIRTDNNPSFGPKFTDRSISSTEFGSNGGSFAPKGDLLGIQVRNNYVLTAPDGSVNIGQTWGGGVLGTHAYLLQNTREQDYRYRSDGGLRMPRQWGRAVFKDFLCRDLPVIRAEDTAGFVKTPAESSVPFRNSSTCVRCHASMDRVTATIRGFTYKLDSGNRHIADAQFADFHAVTQGPEIEWPYNSDSLYANRPPNGVFYFRDYKGVLHNESVVGASGLGNKLSTLEDFYVCAAKRYYKYFTGIDVFMGDEADPSVIYNPSSGDRYHQQIVIQLGQSLMNHQDPKMLINEIMSLPNYRASDFEASNNGL